MVRLEPAIAKDEIETTYGAIRSHIRRTPAIGIDPSDLGSAARRITLELEPSLCDA